MTKNFSVVQENVRVDVSEWCSADIDANREIIFAMGDTHGCADLLDALLNAFCRLAINEELPRRLVFLGDLINRGPHTIKAASLLIVLGTPADETFRQIEASRGCRIPDRPGQAEWVRRNIAKL